MKKVETLLQNAILGAIENTQEGAEHRVKEDHAAYGAESGHDLIDAINQMFAEFELAYHNQFHKAYSAEGSVGLAKKYWLSSLNRFPPKVLLEATRHVAMSSPYLPSLSTVVEACENSMTLFGLPSAYEAYREACCAPEPKSGVSWSHPVVYYAGKAAGWFVLANQPEAQSLPLFEYHYKLLCAQVMNGEAMEVNVPQALPESVTEVLSEETQLKQLGNLRKALKL